MICTIQRIGATTSSSYILSLYGGLCNRRLFARRPTNKRRSKKMTCTRGAFSINSTTYNINFRKANKIKRWRSKVPNPKFECGFEIPKNLLNDLAMWSAWGKFESMHTCTQWIECPAMSSWGTRGSQSCSCTPFDQLLCHFHPDPVSL
jgi:hypothetical protein